MTQTERESSVKTIAATFTILAVVFASAALTQKIYATDYYSGNKWSGTSVNMCYDSFSLADLNIGATNAINELEEAKNAWNSQPSAWTLNRVNPNDFCKNWNSAVTFGRNGVLATTWTTTSGTTITDTDTEYNDSYSWTTSASCSEPYTMSYVANHEFGHWVKFNHPAQSATSVMVPSYDCNKYDTIKTHDSSSLTSIYG